MAKRMKIAGIARGMEDKAVELLTENRDRLDALARLRPLATPAVIASLLATLHLAFPELLQFLARAVAMVGLTVRQHLIDGRPIGIETLCLIHRRIVTIQTEPVYAAEDGLDGGISRSFAVGVLDAQEKLATMVSSEGACAAYHKYSRKGLL
mgnify:CR=1 FL=1